MHGLARLIVNLIANALGLIAAARYVPGFELVENSWGALALMSLILMALNIFLKPVMKLLFGPLILLTLGLGLFIINMGILKLLDIMVENLRIQTIPALIYATFIIGLVNFIFHLAYKREGEDL